MSSHFLSQPEDQQQKNKALIASQVIQAYERLHNNIDDMQGKVEHVIQKHESQFMLAYRAHISKIKRQLGDIKKKSEQQQKMFSSNDRIKYLQKQISIFRQEALRVYDKLEKTNKELELYKRKYEDTLRIYNLSEQTSRQIIKQSKKLNVSQGQHEQAIRQLELELQVKNRQIEQLKRKQKVRSQNHANINLFKSIGTERSSKNRYDKNQSNALESSAVETVTKRTLRIGDSFVVEENSFKDYFFDCVKIVKKEIVMRKSLDKFDVKNISLNEFRDIDKIKVLCIFFSRPELQLFLYEKLFPNKLLKKLNLEKEQKNGNRTDYFQITSPGFVLPRFKDSQRKYASRLEVQNNSFV